MAGQRITAGQRLSAGNCRRSPGRAEGGARGGPWTPARTDRLRAPAATRYRGASMTGMPIDRTQLVEQYLRGETDVVEPRDAATVVLLRDGAAGPEVYLLRRRPTMAFAAGATSPPVARSIPATGTARCAESGHRPPPGPRRSAATPAWPARWCAP